MSWAPPPRPQWVERLIAHGESVGGAERLVSLDGDSLLDAARESTHLEDFGDGAWQEPFGVLLGAMEGESRLHLAGRLLARTELLLALRNRLQLEARWQADPSILSRPVEAPVFIVGSPRSGTSILHELMSCDPATRAPAMWEMQHPVASAEGRDLSDLGDRVAQFWHDLQPEYETMHANSGHLPNECIFITLHEFLSDHWGGNHVVPSYDAHLARADHRPAYRFHRRFLQTLQGVDGARWLLKAPSHLFQLRALLDVYPDARIVRTHRDPLKTLPSALNLMGTLKWMRCEEVDMAGMAARLPFGFAYVFEREISQRGDGTLPDERFVDVHFQDLMSDPVATLAAVYDRLDWELSREVRERIAAYAAQKPKGSRGAHRYSLESVGLDAVKERERFRFYYEHHGVEAERA